MLYLDHNATTELLHEAKIAMLEVLSKPFNASAVHGFGREAKKIAEHARRQIAKGLKIEDNFKDYQITFTASGTEANNLILANYKQENSCTSEIFISATEHASILAHLKYAGNISLISVDKNGIINKDELTQKLLESKADKKLVSVIFANNETGVIQDIKAIAEIAHSFGALMHSDAVQAIGKVVFDFAELDLDFATLSAHKIGGPLGCGALVQKARYHLVPHIIGGGQERGLRSGSENIPAIAGFGVAMTTICGNENVQNARNQYLENLRDYLETELQRTFPAIVIAGQGTRRLPNTSLIMHEGKKSGTQIIALDLQNVAVSSGAACSSGRALPSATLAAMGFNESMINSAIRISLGFTTTKAEIDKFLEIYKKINT